MSSTDHRPLHWDPWLVASVVILCSFAVVLSYYKVLQRFCITFRRARSNTNQRRTHLNDDLSLQFQSHGLDFAIIRSLPITQLKKKSGEDAEDNKSNTDCPVCLGEFEEGEWLRHLPKCNHSFHISCINTWLLDHSNCPLCRSEVYDFIQDCPILMYTLLETLRESLIQERALHYQMLRSVILDNSTFGRQERFPDCNV